jgi:hypothetical protein
VRIEFLSKWAALWRSWVNFNPRLGSGSQIPSIYISAIYKENADAICSKRVVSPSGDKSRLYLQMYLQVVLKYQ